MLNWKNSRILRIFVRSVSSVLIAAFLSYDLVWAGASEVLAFAGRNNLSLAPAIAIPPELGTIKESYLSGPNPQNLVVYIQDAHANKEAQENEVKIISYLQDTYKINLVSAEGGFGDFDADFFQSFPQDKAIRNKIAKYFLDKSFISAVDYLLITSDNPPRVYGAEDKLIYDTHLNAFRKNQAIRDSFKKSLRNIKGLLEALKEKHYSRDLIELDQKIDDFREGSLSLDGFISYLRLTSIIERFSLVSFPNLSTLINLQKLERQINFEKAEGQRQSLIDRLTQTLPKAKLEELLRQSLDFKSGQLRPAKYYAYLEKASQTAAINRQGYFHLFTYIRYLALSESLDNEKILEESAALAEELKEGLVVTALQKDIDSLNNICRILKRLSDIELSPREYEYFKKQRQEFSEENLRSLIARCASSPFAGTLPTDQEIKSLERFYSLAYERDKAIVINSLNRLKSEYGARAVILVAGGFHTPGITSLLKEKGVSYLVVAPKITPKQERQELYFSLLNEKKLNLDDILSESDTLQVINSISEPQARRLFISYWIARASRYYPPVDLEAQLSGMSLSPEDRKAVETALRQIPHFASASHGTSEPAPENGKDVKRRGQFDTPIALVSSPVSLRQEIKNRISQVGQFMVQGVKDALNRALRSIMPLPELPLPVPLSMIDQQPSDRDKVIYILNAMQKMMDGTDEKVIRDFERAVDNARDKLTEHALDNLGRLSDSEIYQLVTNGYLRELEGELQRVINGHIQHMVRFHSLSHSEQNLYVSQEINEKYSRLPRYLKWLLSNNSYLEVEPEIARMLSNIQHRLRSMPPEFLNVLTVYSQTALNKSLYLNPELALKILRYLSKDIIHSQQFSEDQIKDELTLELSSGLPQDSNAIKPVTEEPKVKKPSVIEYQEFLLKFNRQDAGVKRLESELAELNEGFEQAKKQNDKIIIEALNPSIEGLKAKLEKERKTLANMLEEKYRYEKQIKQGKETKLYSVDPAAVAGVAFIVATVGIPLYVSYKTCKKVFKGLIWPKIMGILFTLGSIFSFFAFAVVPYLGGQFSDLLGSLPKWAYITAAFFTVQAVSTAVGVTGGLLGGTFGRLLSGRGGKEYRLAADKFAGTPEEAKKVRVAIKEQQNRFHQKNIEDGRGLFREVLTTLIEQCRSREEFVYWLKEAVNLPESLWTQGKYKVLSALAYQRAAESTADKFTAQNSARRDFLISINDLRDRLAQKGFSNASDLFKDILPELAKTCRTREEFIYWIGEMVNLNRNIWSAGHQAVINSFNQMAGFNQAKEAVLNKFGATKREKDELSTAIDNLRTKLNEISLAKNAIAKISASAGNLKEFMSWMEWLSKLQPEILTVLCRDIDTLLAYYRDKGRERDLANLPNILNEWYKVYRQVIAITPVFLDILTDPAVDIQRRIEKSQRLFAEQKIVKLGAPPNLIGLKDAVSFEQLLAITGEEEFRNVINYYWQETNTTTDDEGNSSSDTYNTSHQPIRQIISKMGKEGMYSYWESHRPNYYQQFIQETKGLSPGFNRPGEKFRVAYDDMAVQLPANQAHQLMPIADNVEALKQLIKYLRMEWPNLYDNFISPKREMIKDRVLEEFITSETVIKMAQQLLNKLQNWDISEQQKAEFMAKIMEIFAFQETGDFRSRINGADGSVNKLRLASQYWDRVLDLMADHKWLKERSKFSQMTSRIIKQRAAVINDKVGEGGKGILQFYLSGGSLADFFRGIVSNDCTRSAGQRFQDTLATVADPAFSLFKIIEDGKWVGNIYSVVFKTQDDKLALFVDVFQMNLAHPLVANGSNWNVRKKKFFQSFFSEFKSYLASQGFDYLIFANTHSSQNIGSDIHNEVVKESGKTSPGTISLKKPGGLGHLSEGGLPAEYVQGTGNIYNGFQQVSGYMISLDKTNTVIVRQKQKDIDFRDKLLSEMDSEEQRLAKLVKDKEKEKTQILKKGQEAANSGREAIANALKTAYEQKNIEIKKIEYELNELKNKIQEKKQELQWLKSSLGASSSLSGKILLSSSLAFSGLFLAGKASAGDLSFAEELLDSLLILGGMVALFGIFIYAAHKLFSPKSADIPYPHLQHYEDRRERVYFEDNLLPTGIENKLNAVLNKVSARVREIIPLNIEIRVPYDIGIGRGQALKALDLLFSKLIEHNSILDFLREQTFYLNFKQKAKELGLSDNFDIPGAGYSFEAGKEEIPYELKLSERSADDILRGVASGDCTSINGTAFYNTIPQFLFDPGFLAFKVFQENKWVGNVYTIAAKKEGDPALVIDAVQLPSWGRSWPVSVTALADKIVEQIIAYAREQGFRQVLMSSFVSNFNILYEHFKAKYPVREAEIEKLGGFEHLKALGIWNDDAARNQYIETFSPQWNYPLKKVNPNEAMQKLLLREVWHSEEDNKADKTSVDTLDVKQPSQNETETKTKGREISFIKKVLLFITGKLRPVAVGILLFLTVAFSNISSAGQLDFSARSVFVSGQSQAVVYQDEKSDMVPDKEQAGLELLKNRESLLEEKADLLRIKVKETGIKSGIVSEKQGIIIERIKEIESEISGLRKSLPGQNRQDELLRLKESLIKGYEYKVQRILFADDFPFTGYDPNWPDMPLNLSAEINMVGRSGYIEGLRSNFERELKRITLEEESRELNNVKISALQKELKSQIDKLSEFAELKEELDKEQNRYTAEKQDSENKISQTRGEIETAPSIVKKEFVMVHPEVSPAPEITPEPLPEQETAIKQGIIRWIQAQMALHVVLVVSIFSGLLGLTLINVIAFIMYKKFRGKPVYPAMTEVELRKIQADLEALENKRSEVKEELNKLSEEKAEADKETVRIKQEKGEIESRLAVLKEELYSAEKSVEQLKNSNEDYEKKAGAIQSEIKGLIIKKQECQEAVLRFNKQAQEALAITQEKEKEKESLLKAIADLQEKQRMLLRDEVSLSENKASLSAETEALDKNIIELKVQAGQLEEKKTSLSQDIARLLEEKSGLEEKTISAKGEQDVLADSFAGILSKIEKTRIEFNSLKSEIKSLNDTKLKLKNEIDRLKEDKKEARKEAEAEVTAENLIDSQEKVEEAQKRIEESEKVVAELKKQADSYQEDIRRLEEKARQMEAQGNDIQRLKSQKEGLESEISRLLENKESLGEQLTQTKTALKEVNDRFADLQGVIRRLEKQSVVLKGDISALEERKDALRKELADLEDEKDRLKEIIPETDALLESSRMAARITASTHLRKKEDRENVANTFVKLVRIKSHSGSENIIREELKRHMLALGANLVLEDEPIKNLVVEFPAAKGYENEPAVILNAHMDTVRQASPENMEFSTEKREFYHSQSGSFGADDKAGITVIAEALRILKQRWWDNGYGHRRIMVIFTASEETGFAGAKQLVEKHKDLFSGNTLLSLTIDGPMDYASPNPENPFVIVLPSGKQSDPKSKAIIDAVTRLTGKKFNQAILTQAGLGIGDFAVFSAVADSDLHIRAPHKGFHANERVKIDDLIDVIDHMVQWLAELDRNIRKTPGANSAKGKGMFSPEDHDEVNNIIKQAREERRGRLIWGNVEGWPKDKEEDNFLPGIIDRFKDESPVTIAGLGSINIHETLLNSNIILIAARKPSPAGLVVKGENVYQLAHNSLTFNSIYIDEYTYQHLYLFQIPAFLAHEAVELGAKRLCQESNIPWTVELAKKIDLLAQECEKEMLGGEDHSLPPADTERKESPNIAGPKVLTLENEEGQGAGAMADNLRKLFLESMPEAGGLMAYGQMEYFPAQMAREIEQAYQSQKVRTLPLSADHRTILTMFFSNLFPNHSANLINYMKNLSLYLIDTDISTYGATLSGNVFYIQKSCINNVSGSRLGVDEIFQAIENKDQKIAVALFRILVHEIGAAFFKLSHLANQDLEKLFLAKISKTDILFPVYSQKEIDSVNDALDLGNKERTDWAGENPLPMEFNPDVKIEEYFVNLSSEIEGLADSLTDALFSKNQDIRNNAAKTLAEIGYTDALTFLNILSEKYPDNQSFIQAKESLGKTMLEQLDSKLSYDYFARYLFSMKNYRLALNLGAARAVNILSDSYGKLVLDIDVDTLIDTSADIPRLKGLHFKETAVYFYNANAGRKPKFRLVNINPKLNKDKIIKILNLDNKIIEDFISIPDIPPDYRVNGLEPYLEKNSIRIVYEDNAAYWGQKIDVLVKRGREDEVISSLGLIVAALAKEPAFYDGLPLEVKEYISASADNEGRSVLDDDRKFKQLIFKPIEKTKVDIRYLDRLYKENRELEAMA